MSSHAIPTPRGYILVFLALMVLTATTVWAAFQDFGRWNDVVALGIASVKATLVLVFFMQLRHSTRVVKLAMLSSLAFFLLLISFLMADVLTRGIFEAPIQPLSGF